VQVGVAEVEARGQHPLVEEMERVLGAVADGAEDLVRAPRHPQTRLGRVRFRRRD
jgi:hypothetical protein